MTDIIIIGAGVAGLACARRLADAGLHVTVIDKGRGIGGRVATRRAGDLLFDHGAPYARAHGDEFTNVLRGLCDNGHAAAWSDSTGEMWTVGTPGMSAIPKGMAAGLDVHLATQVRTVVPNGSGWSVQCDDQQYNAHRVVITVPAPQVAGLLGAQHPLVAQIADVEMSPGLTLMAVVSGDPPSVRFGKPNDPLAFITRDSSKPDRPQIDGTAWVAQAGLAFSHVHLEDNLPDIAAKMLPLLCNRLGITSEHVTHAVAQRWRYSRVANPLGRPFACAPDKTLYLGGDWCVGPLIEDAWTSGTAIATDLLAQAI
jgi:renalase